MALTSEQAEERGRIGGLATSTRKAISSAANGRLSQNGGRPAIRDAFSDLPISRQAKHQLRHPEREAARRAVKEALRVGGLIRQPCEVCGSTPADAHHPDYSKPLDVQWLCKPHHGHKHRKGTKL